MMPIWLVVLISFVIPGAGYVILGKPARGLIMAFWMILFGVITFNLTSENISFIGRVSGGIAIWTLSQMEVYRIAKQQSNRKKNTGIKGNARR